MLTEADKNYITERLATELGVRGTPRQDLVAPFYMTQFAVDLREGSPRNLADHAINLCISDGYTHDPTWLELIITNFQLDTIDAKVGEILERARQKPKTAPNLLDSHVLSNGSPFVNRVTFRSKINRLNNSAANTQPILIVSGSTKSGKSYSHNFIDHFTNQYNSIFVYKYEFDNDLGLEIGPERVARDLVAKMGRSLDKIPPLETNLKLYSRQLALWVLNEAAQTAAQHWFVLDNFGGEKLRQDTRDFILSMTDIVTTGIFQKRCRMILIGFDPSLLTIDQAQFDEEFIAKCTPEDVKKTVTEIVKQAPAPVEFDEIYSFVTDALPSGPDKMLELNARLRSLLYAFAVIPQIVEAVKGVVFKQVLMNMLQDLPPGRAKMRELKQRLQILLESSKEMPDNESN